MIDWNNEKFEEMQLSHLTIENAPGAYFWVNDKGNILRVNQTAKERLGYSSEDYFEMTICKVFPDLSGEAWKDLWEKIENKKIITFESKQLRKDGITIPVEVKTNFLSFKRKSYACLIAVDISNRKYAEAKLNRSFEEVAQLKDRLEAENIYLQDEIKLVHNFEEIISRSKVFKKVLGKVEQVAITDATVLVLGETGTGKELLVRALHNISRRCKRPLVKVNCAALPASLIESELFGHEKGAFTGALMRKIGRFELADGGTIFLDEIGELPIELQTKLLRVLQEGEFERLGNSQTLSVDVRVIAATNIDIVKAVEEGNFRADLYYRLNVFPITIPSLKERKEDIPVLVNHFVNKYSQKFNRKIESIPQKSMDSFERYHWPGNIRELENIIERSVIISNGKKLITGDWLPKGSKHSVDAHILTIEELERNHITEVLELVGWRVSGEKGAAKILDIKPTTLEARMKKLGIERIR